MREKGDRLRILIGKPGLCGHDRGAIILAMALRDNGMEVIYSGRHNTPEQLVKTAIQEDVDVLGVSILSGAHVSLCKRIAELLRKEKAVDICFVAGGFIPDEDIPVLRDAGVWKVFPSASSLKEIVSYIQAEGKRMRKKDTTSS